MEEEDLRKVLQEKAERHQKYYKSLLELDNPEYEILPTNQENVTERNNDSIDRRRYSITKNEDNAGAGSQNSTEQKYRRRRQGVYEITGTLDYSRSRFESVKQLRDKYMAMLEKTYKYSTSYDKQSDLTEKKKSELLVVPPSSGYCSSSASGASDDEREKEKKWSQKKLPVLRSASTDSAVHSDEEESMICNWYGKKGDYEASQRSPYSPRTSVDHSNVPSKMIIPGHYVPLAINRKFSVDCVSEVPSDGVSDSRRQSCVSEGDEQHRYRYWRTPSVVVSDYSDNICGITLEDIEYIRSKRNSISPTSSLQSSCSNLNYCGSSISGLGEDYVLCKPYRKSSNCSTCSTSSDEEENSEEAGQEPSAYLKENREVSFFV
ncbi:hypothetical protein JTB14_009426 [Gonioctena quinquepunctata]|nr:hypothetical protein JTB14_009426 [Gonioctena quinquepunctata]